MIRFKLNTKNGIVKAYIQKRCVATITPLTAEMHAITYQGAIVTDTGITVGYNYKLHTSETYPTTEEAKRAIVAHFVAQRLEQP